ncbi:MAG: TonB-dependent receptor, partial [Gallionella sp.]|nr:TonB-dependent receptor [Gallionella sp.]
SIGVRAPFFKRELNQYCYSRNGSSSVLCTTQTPNAPLANGNVTFGASGTQYIPPYAMTKEYDDILPNLGVSWNFAENQFVYASYAEGLSAPRTDNLYTPLRLASGAIALPGAEPETTKTFDLGYRYQSSMITGQAAIWTTAFENYIVSSFDEDLGIFVDRNVGGVDLWGVDAQVGFEPTENWSIYGFTSYTNSELQDDIPLSATTFLPTAGKTLVETPEWTAGFYVRWEATENLSLSFEGKHVGDRFSTDVNDQATPAYDLYKFGARYDLPFLGEDGSYIQVNVINLFDEEYLGNISSRNTAKTVDVLPGPGVTNRAGSAPFHSVGAPRTLQVTFRANF